MPNGFEEELKKWEEQAKSSWANLQEIESRAAVPRTPKEDSWWKRLLRAPLLKTAFPPWGVYQVVKALRTPEEETIARELRSQQEEALTTYAIATWFSDAYSATGPELKSIGISSFSDYIKMSPPDPSSSPTDLLRAKEHIESTLAQYPTEPTVLTPEQKEAAERFITEPLITKPKFVGVHLTTVHEMLQWLNKEVPILTLPESLEDEDLLAYLREEGFSEEEIAEATRYVESKWSTMFEQHQAEREQIEKYRAGIDTPEMPEETWRRKLERAGSQPALGALDALSAYWKYVEQPIAAQVTYAAAKMPSWLLGYRVFGFGMGLGKEFPAEVEKSVQAQAEELKASHKANRDAGMNYWTAWGKAWEEWEAPAWSKLTLEIVADPLNLIGFGWFTKLAHATKAIRYVGRFTKLMGAVEEGWIKTAEWLPIKLRDLYRRIPPTRGQRAALAGANNMNVVHASQAHDYPTRRGAMEAAMANPEEISPLADLGRRMLERMPMTQDDFFDWGRRVGTKVTPEELSPQSLYAFEELVDSVKVRGSLHPITGIEETSQMMLRQFFKVNDDEVNMKIARNLIEELYQTTITIADDTAKLPKDKFLQAMGKKGEKIVLTASYVDDWRFKFHHGVWSQLLGEYRGLARIWANTIDKHLVMPFARAYLITASYAPYNYVEEILRTWFGGGGGIYGKGAPARADRLFKGVMTDRKIFEDALRLSNESYKDAIKSLAKEGKPGIGETAEAVERGYGKVPLEKLIMMGFHPKLQSVHEALYFPIRASQWAGGIERSGYIVAKWFQKLETNASDIVTGIRNAVGDLKTVPNVAGAPNSLRKGIHQEVLDAAFTGPDEVVKVSKRFTYKNIRLREVANARAKHPGMGSGGDYLMTKAESNELWGDIPGHVTVSKNMVADEYLKSPEAKITTYRRLVDDMLESPDLLTVDSKETIQGLSALLKDLSDDAPETIHSLRQAYGVRAAGMPSSIERDALWNDARARIGPFLDEMKTQTDRVHEFLRKQYGGAYLTESQWDGVRASADLYMQRVAKILETRSKASIAETDLLARGIRPGASEWQSELGKIWDEHRLVDAPLKATSGAQDRATSNLIAKQDIPTPLVDASIKGLTPADVARVLYSTGDQLSHGIMQSSAMQPREYFVAEVQQRAMEMATIHGTTREALGFTDEAISEVYDQLIYGIRSTPEAFNVLTPKYAEIDNFARDLEAIRINKTLNPNVVKAYREWADGVADRLRELDIYRRPPEPAIKPVVEPVTPEVVEFIAAFDRSYTKAFAGFERVPPDHAIGLRGIASELGMDFNSPAFKSRIQRMVDMGAESPYTFAPTREAKNNLQIYMPGILHEQSIGLATRRPVAKPPAIPKVPITPGVLSAADEALVAGKHPRYGKALLDYNNEIARLEAEEAELIARSAPEGEIARVRASHEKLEVNRTRVRKNAAEAELLPTTEAERKSLLGKAEGKVRRTETRVKKLEAEVEDLHKVKVADRDEAWGDAVEKLDARLDDANEGLDAAKAHLEEVRELIAEPIVPIVPEVPPAIPPTVPPKKPPVPLREGTDDWWNTKQKAMDEALVDYYHDFTDYTNANSLDLFMRNIFPYWQYESQRWFWLSRNYMTHPGVMNIWGKYMDNSDYGYVHIPGTSLELNFTRGTVYKGGLSSLVRRDYPEYYDRYFPEFFESLDYAQRFGFFPNVFWNFPIQFFGGREPKTGQLMPAILRTPMDLWVAAHPESKAGKALQQILFPDQFRDYMTMTQASHMATDDQVQRGVNGETIWVKLQGIKPLTEEEQDLWDRARGKVGLVGPLLEHGGIFRLRHRDRIEAYSMVEQYIEEITGLTPEFQKELRMHGYSPGDIIKLNQADMAVLEEALEYKRWIGPRITAALRPSHEIEVNLVLSKFWGQVHENSENSKVLQQRLANQAFRGIDGRISRLDFVDGMGDIMRSNSEFIHRLHGDIYSPTTGQWESNPDAKTEFSMVPITLEERARFYEERGVNLSLSTFDEMLAEWYQIPIREKIDPETNTVEKDWGLYFATLDILRDRMPDNLRTQWDNWINRNFIPEWLLWKDVTQRYLVPYWNVADVIKADLFTTEEQELIDRYYKLRRIEPLQAQEMLDILRPDGTKLISQYNIAVRDARKKLRMVNPMVDAQLLYWGRTTTLLTPDAEQLYSQLARDYAR